MEIPPPLLSDDRPAFVDENCLEETTRTEDTINVREPPIAFIRCSGGEKTRALIMLHNQSPGSGCRRNAFSIQ